MIPDTNNLAFKLAFDFVNTTSSHLYLTGKAGTGKTTFLKYIKSHCTKKLVIVAPTGVAAINAGGVTMHSFFHLPFGPYLPHAKTGFGMNEGVVDKNALFKNLKFNSTKRKIIEELQLLIIDEVSMLRSDILDAIDTILRTFRKNKNPFGGVQVLFIGDLYQLPPVVKDAEKQILDEYYRSPFFFDAKVLEQTSLVYLELKKIYRQNEESFINILNKLRHSNLDEDDFITLNKRYDPAFQGKDKNYITLTTHNSKADVINSDELKQLSSPQYEFKGEIVGDFGDKQLPTDLILRLKEGAQVMFIKNDSSGAGKYYNGKIVVISKIDGDEIYVRFPETNEELLVSREKWENINYMLNKETNAIDEKVSGEFTQFPLRLAWAITIHKSQGLTFEKAIIDAGNSFAPGQVYVALSRCTSLEGLVLHSRITENALYTEDRILNFHKNEQKETVLMQQLKHEQFRYQSERLITLFRWKKILEAMYALEEASILSKVLPDKEEAIVFAKKMIDKAKEQNAVAEKFIAQLDSILNDVAFTQKSDLLKDRVKKGIAYFIQSLHKEIIQPLEVYIQTIQGKAKIKKYFHEVQAVELTCWQKINELQECTYNEEILCDPSVKVSKVQTKIVATKKEKGESQKETLVYFLSGKSIEEVAKLRGLALSTVEGHLIPFIKTGELEISRLMGLEQVDKVKQAYLHAKDKSLPNLKKLCNDEFSYSEIRFALNHLSFTGEIENYPGTASAKIETS